MAGDSRLPAAAMEKSVSLLAHRDILGTARRWNRPARVSRLRVGASRGAVAIPEMGLANAPPVL